MDKKNSWKKIRKIQKITINHGLGEHKDELNFEMKVREIWSSEASPCSDDDRMIRNRTEYPSKT